MTKKNVRTMKVCGQSGYKYVAEQSAGCYGKKA